MYISVPLSVCVGPVRFTAGHIWSVQTTTTPVSKLQTRRRHTLSCTSIHHPTKRRRQPRQPAPSAIKCSPFATPGHLPLDTDICPGPNHNRSLTLTSLRWPWFLGSLHDAAHSALGRRRQISIDSWRAPLLRVDRHQSVVVPLTAYWLSTGQTDRQTDGHRTVNAHRWKWTASIKP